jgi:hypothetical protein
MTRTLICWIVLVVQPIFAQDVQTVVARMQQVYSGAESLSYKSTYTLYKGSAITAPVSTYEGYIYRQGKELYQKIDQSAYIYGTDFFLKINYGEEAIEIEPAQASLQTDIDLEVALKVCSASRITETRDHYLVTLIYDQQSGIPFSSVLLRISRQDFTLQQLDLFYANAQDFSGSSKEPDLNLPHLQITFSDLQLNPGPQPELLQLSSYIETISGALQPKVPFETYSLNDNRLK